MRVLLTGAAGFLGWHTRARLQAQTGFEVAPINRTNWSTLTSPAGGADAVLHIAGVNRGDSTAVERSNVALAEAVAGAVTDSKGVKRIVYANSIQAGNGTPYGTAKEAAGEVLAAAAAASGATYVDVRLPNLFGEHGRPNYNSFVATFIDCVARDVAPVVNDREVHLLHVQDAAQVLIDGLAGESRRLAPAGRRTTVQEVYNRLVALRQAYRVADIPQLEDQFDVDLFNSLRARLFPSAYPIELLRHADRRGWFAEVVRGRTGHGQTSLSTTEPGITRGEHFHLRKVERFVVVSGSARISLRRLYDTEVISFDVSGDPLVAIDMPTLWAHNITNTGQAPLMTLFWSNDLFDPSAPDTFAERVELSGAAAC